MSGAPVPFNESRRLAFLRELCILDTPSDQAFDLVTQLACRTFNAPMAVVSLLDKDRQWFKSKVGIEGTETPRDQAFCAYAILEPEVMVVLDARQDERFRDNPLVTGAPGIRFYAGAPLMSREGLNLGALCVIDTVPRAAFGPHDQALLSNMAAMVVQRLEALRALGYMDQTLALPNRARLLDDLHQYSESGLCGPGRHVAMAVDLCGADYFNDTVKALGYRYADDYLIASKDRLIGLLPDNCPVYRISATRLGFILEHSDQEVAGLLGDIARAFALPLWVGDIPHNARATLGALRLPTTFDPADVLRALVSACDSAREQGDNWSFYDSRQHDSHNRAYKVLTALSMTLHRDSIDEFTLHYQPKVNLHTGQCTGVEALLRWHSPTLGTVSPAEFIPLAEKTALIERITGWVMDEAMRQASVWQQQGLRLPVAFNASAVDLDRPSFTDELCTCLLRHGVDPHLIELEFTESALTHSPDRLREHLQSLQALGMKVSIDDFGTGYSNLTYLKTLAANTLKVDQSFIRNLLDNATDQAIVPALVTLAHKTKHKVVAEGIETHAAYTRLAAWGCDQGQGYWIAKPMAAQALEQWLRDDPVRTSGLGVARPGPVASS